MPVVRFFASAREAAGTGRLVVDAPTVGAALDAAKSVLGEELSTVLPTCRVWVNGEPAVDATPVSPDDEVAVLPPVSGG